MLERYRRNEGRGRWGRECGGGDRVLVWSLRTGTGREVRTTPREMRDRHRETHESFDGLLAGCADFKFCTRDSRMGGSMLCSAQTVGIDS